VNSTPIFPTFEYPVSDRESYMCRASGLWWKATIVHRNGSVESGDYGVIVTAKAEDGRLVAYEVSPYIYPRGHTSTASLLSRQANSMASRAAAAALRRAEEGSYLRIRQDALGFVGDRPTYEDTQRPGFGAPQQQHRSVFGRPRTPERSVFSRGPGPSHGADQPRRSIFNRSRSGYGGYTAAPAKPKATLDTDAGKTIEREAATIKTTTKGDDK